MVIVVVQHLFQSLKPAIMHVRCGDGNIAQGGYTESSQVAPLAGDIHSSRIIRLNIQTIIMKKLLVKFRRAMTMAAVGTTDSVPWIRIIHKQVEPQ